MSHDVTLHPTPDPAVLELADYMRGSDNAAYPLRRFPYDMKACLGKLFLSQYFHDATHIQTMHKTPVEYVISALKGLGIDDFYTSLQGPPIYLTLMGMRLHNPPNVAGWNHGRNWSSSGNLILRSYYAFRVAYELLNGFTEYGKAVLDRWLVDNGGSIDGFDDDVGLVDYVAERLLQGAMTGEERDLLLDALSEIHALAPAPIFAESRYYLKAAAVVYLTMTMPGFQLK